MDVVRRTLVGATTPTFMVLVVGAASTALSLRPAFIPLVFTISILVNYARATVNKPEFTHRFFALLATLSMATLAAYSSSTYSALSTRFLSGGLLLAVAAIFSGVALLPILVYARARVYVGSRSAFSGMLLFPTLWVTTWSLFVYLSPLGRIGTWTPMTGIEDYYWVTPVFGQAGLDYITALWAVVIAEYTGEWLMGPSTRDQLPKNAHPNIDFLGTIDHEAEDADIIPADPPHRSNPAPWLLGLLLLAILPSYRTPILPTATHSANTTELTVACVHPYVHDPRTPLTFDEYLAETKTQVSRAKIVLWPEGAVHFRSDKERTKAFAEVSEVANHQKAWIGVAFEQSFSDSNETVFGKRVRGHNGLTIFGPDMEPVTYIKRRLVPLVESFSLESSIDPPPRYPVSVPLPKSHPKSDKSSWPRTIPVTAAICLDVSAPLATSVPVDGLTSELGRPALIIAPARTWHPEVGKAMFQYASMRATEQGASILWCDGGEGGVSGVGGLAAQGLGLVGGIGQVGGGGSWIQTIGIPFPYDAQTFTPTWYARWGDLSAVFLAWAVLSVGFAGPLVQGGGNFIELVARRLQRREDERPLARNENTPLLIDA